MSNGKVADATLMSAKALFQMQWYIFLLFDKKQHNGSHSVLQFHPLIVQLASLFFHRFACILHISISNQCEEDLLNA